MKEYEKAREKTKSSESNGRDLQYSPLINKKHERQRTKKKGTPITDDRNGFAGDPRRAYVRHTVMWSEPLINAARNPAERFFHLMLHSTSTLITTSISSHRLKYLTTNTHT